MDDVARKDGEKQVGPALCSAGGASTSKEDNVFSALDISSKHTQCEFQMLNSMMMTRGMERRERRPARGSFVDESRMVAAKILVTPHQGYLVYEQLQKKKNPTSRTTGRH